jgi:hypothetical protein
MKPRKLEYQDADIRADTRVFLVMRSLEKLTHLAKGFPVGK